MLLINLQDQINPISKEIGSKVPNLNIPVVE